MKIIDFKGRNAIFGANQPEYLPLYAYRHEDNEGTVSSCWKLSFRERLRVLITGRMYVSLMTFNTPICPQFVSLDNPVQPKP